ncbi:YqeG family HAD IIIA-type phosphatase [Meiothermus taiwanensis]|uniref:HAD superfamily (Subfamily IIIA) phosphatase n=1 Tax=Meiothermus taiwanensis WR-220 TaxID=1339250 RepID=A0ABM6WG89_9DEIN|nr:YqeG family HAD IIIA-type phosphatase [Meiothermus taiwanensis]AWR85944.1 HAD superfamily (subfamily IIIA) phosphatase [Meiothermus taiwanensis WR-220]
MVLKPRAQLNSVTEVTPAWLQERGLRAVLLDLDNTLVPYRTYGEVPEALQAWLQTQKQAGIPVMLVSNATSRRVRYWCEKLGIPGFGLAGKPWFGFREALRRLGLRPEEVAVVGDQLFTDVLGGNLVGMYTVLVPPLAQQELGYTRLVRRLERWILRNANRQPPTRAQEEFDPKDLAPNPRISKD